jgi:predicted nucleic acid-binding Zn ribbon protein
VALHLLRCAVCGEAFEAARRDAVTCSKRCRSRRERAEKRRREMATVREIAEAVALLRSLRAVAEMTPAD